MVLIDLNEYRERKRKEKDAIFELIENLDESFDALIKVWLTGEVVMQNNGQDPVSLAINTIIAAEHKGFNIIDDSQERK